MANTIRKFRTKQKAVKIIDDVDLENTVNNISFNRMIKRTDQMLDTVGLNEKTAPYILEEEPTVPRRRVVRSAAEVENDDMTRWTALKDHSEETNAAAFRARQSRARLNDLEDEMEEMAERQAARERRAANLRAILAENAEESEAIESAMNSASARISARAEKKTVTF